MTRIAKPMLIAALAALVWPASAAHAKQATNSTSFKSKCTVVAVVLGTGWDVVGGNSSCSMFSRETKSTQSADAKRQGIASDKVKK